MIVIVILKDVEVVVKVTSGSVTLVAAVNTLDVVVNNTVNTEPRVTVVIVKVVTGVGSEAKVVVNTSVTVPIIVGVEDVEDVVVSEVVVVCVTRYSVCVTVVKVVVVVKNVFVSSAVIELKPVVVVNVVLLNVPTMNGIVVKMVCVVS